MLNDYNYRNFHAKDYDFSNFTGLQVGAKVPDADLLRPDGTPVRLSALLDKPLVLETGSLTCPMYAKCVEPMQGLTSDHPELNFSVLYVREAHPGERHSAHAEIQEKLDNAQQTQNAYGEQRQIVVDSLDGDLHLALGGLPNMLYILDVDRTILFRTTWNNTTRIESVLEAVNARKPIQPGDFKPASPTPFKALRTLLFGGLRAVYDFIVELPRLLRMHAKEGNL